MAKARGRGKPLRRRDKRGGPGSGRRKPCQYCRDKIEQVDYKDVAAFSILAITLVFMPSGILGRPEIEKV